MRPTNTITTEMIERRNELLVYVSSLTGVAGDDIMSSRRTDMVSMARHLAMWVMTDIFCYPINMVAVLMRRHRTSVVYGRQEMRGLGRKMPAKYVDKIMKQIKDHYNETAKEQVEAQPRQCD